MVQIGFVHPPCTSDGIGDLIAVDVPVPEMSVDEAEPGTTLPRKRVRRRNGELADILEDMQCCDDPFGLQERFRECIVNQVVGQQHFAEQNIVNSVDVVTSPTRSAASNVDFGAETTSTAETNKDKTHLLSVGNIITDNLSTSNQ